MRSIVADYQVISPPTLSAALSHLSAEPGAYTPLAGGTELMVALGAGRLSARKLLSLHLVKELRFIDITSDWIDIGAGCTFTDLRRHPAIASDLGLLAQAAGWTGSLANQNRGTLGGNIVNASPAADSSPALLVYDAHVTLVSSEGARTLPYREFHLGYKKTALRVDELVQSLRFARNYSSYKSYIRKVGARAAQAISKVAVAGLAQLDGEKPVELRLAAASLREMPIRLYAAEQAVLGRVLNRATLPSLSQAVGVAIAGEARPIDDIRSTARYRSAAAANLVAEFLSQLAN